MGFFSRHRKAFKSVIASFGMLFGLLAGVSVTANVGYAELNNSLTQLLNVSTKGGTWGMSNDSINGEVTGTKVVFEYPASATLNLTNNCGNPIELSFDWSATIPSSKGSVTVDGQKYTTSQSLSTKKIDRLEHNSTVSIKIEATGKNTTKIQISRISAVKILESTITFKKANFGHYYVNDVLVDDGFQQPGKQLSTTAFRLNAKADDGYEFFGWQTTAGNVSKIVSIDNPYEFKSAEDCEVTAIFKKGQNLAVFSNDFKFFGDLNEAISNAKASSDKTIIAAKDGIVPAGNYVLDSDLSLLIPNDATSQLDDYATPEPKYDKNYQTCVKYRKLTFENGTNLNVLGQIVLCCKPWFNGVPHSGVPSGSYGQIELKTGSTISLENGAKLYAWGFITGDGNVWAKNGSLVYELFQMAGWRGGRASSGMLNNSQKVFVMNQYYVQNIEALLRMDAGAIEKTLTGVTISLGDISTLHNPCFTFIGEGGMFVLQSGYLTKKYDPNSDRLNVKIHGQGILSSISFKISTYTIDSAKYVLPINNNISIEISDGYCSTQQDLAFLPGSDLIVKQGASFEISTGHNVIFYDGDNWGNYAVGSRFQSVKYSPTKKKNRTNADLVDAKLSLDGTLIVGSGSYLMTTGNEADTAIGARIISPNRTGAVKFTDAGANSCPKAYQYESDYVEIPRSCAKLQNGDHSYTQSAPGNTYNYDKVLDRWSLSTDHATKSGLFKTIDNGGVIKTVLLENDVMSTGRSGLFHYSSTTYKAGDNHYYYLQSGVVVSNKKWHQEGGKWYFFGSNQYAYQNMSAAFTASTGITGFGIQARYFFNNAATVERLVTVNNVVGLSRDITIGSDNDCYYKSIKAGIGLFEKQSGSNYSVYLAKDDGTLMTDGTYYVPSHKINNIKDSSGKVLTAGLYYFDDNGHMYDSNYKVIARGNAS